MTEIKVQPLDVMADANWSYRDSQPTYKHATFDPFPAYAHDIERVRAAAAFVAACWKPSWDIDLYVADREEVGRSNGFSSLREGGHYDDAGDYVTDPLTGLIMLSGKRIPPHPAMTRYLVAHEYGHHVEWMLNKALGAKHVQDERLAGEYAKFRGLPDAHFGSGGRWHDAVAEVFACDFRILVCGVEIEFWPHPGVPRPEDVDGLRDWWTDQIIATPGPDEDTA